MASSKPDKTPAEPGLDARAKKVIAVVILAPFMTQMDSTVVNVALSSITEALHSTIASAQWIVSGYLLAQALMLPLNGWLVDRVGAKRLYLVCFASFTATSFLCGAAHTMAQLIGARILQGMVGGLLAPLTQLMMVRVAGSQMVRVFGYAAAPILLAPLLGPILAGAILKHVGWAWLFYINLPVGVLALILSAVFIPHDESQLARRQFDLKGFMLISPGLVILLYGVDQASQYGARALWAIAAGAILLLAFVKVARGRKDAGLIDVELFAIRTFSVAAVTQFLANGIMYASQFLVPLYLTAGCGLSATQAGWILASMGIGMLCIYPLLGHLTERFGVRAVASGGVLVNLCGTLPFLVMAYHGFSRPLALGALFLRGFGQGSTGIPSISAAYASVPAERLSFATTSINIVQRLGGPVMTTVVAIVVSLSGKGGSAHSYVLPFATLIGLQLLVWLSARQLPVSLPKEHQSTAGADQVAELVP
jgi:EmrB/QacA subfamily drug resistance transporter